MVAAFTFFFLQKYKNTEIQRKFDGTLFIKWSNKKLNQINRMENNF